MLPLRTFRTFWITTGDLNEESSAERTDSCGGSPYINDGMECSGVARRNVESITRPDRSDGVSLQVVGETPRDRKLRREFCDRCLLRKAKVRNAALVVKTLRESQNRGGHHYTPIDHRLLGLMPMIRLTASLSIPMISRHERQE